MVPIAATRPSNKTIRKVISALRSRKAGATRADIISRTGFSGSETESTLRTVLDEYRGQLKVAESGELLYYFPEGFRNRERGFRTRFSRFLRKIISATGKIFMYLFKAWIFVMLVGYFFLFIALIVLSIVASIAGSGRGGRGRGRMGGFGGFYLTTRLIQLFAALWFSGYGRGYGRRRVKKRVRPIHQSVFAYVFGDGDPNAEREVEERKIVIRFIQTHKGIVSLDELVEVTGRDHDDAQLLLNSLLREYEGVPEVTEEGTLYYSFSKLMFISQDEAETMKRMPTEFRLKRRPLIPFNNNPKKTNRWITFANSFNIIFGGYFLYYSLAPIVFGDRLGGLYRMVLDLINQATGAPQPLTMIALGIVPLAFSIIFFIVTIIRIIRKNAKNRKIRKRNFQQKVLSMLLDRPDLVSPKDMEATIDEEKSVKWKDERHQIVESLNSRRSAEVTSGAGKEFIYSFPEISREQRELAQLRDSIDESIFDIGEVVYDSGTNKE